MQIKTYAKVQNKPKDENKGPREQKNTNKDTQQKKPKKENAIVSIDQTIRETRQNRQ